MNDFPASPADPQPAAPAPGQPAGTASSVRISLPSAVPAITYTIITVTVTVYLLQLASVYFLGYANASSRLDWLEAYGAKINELIRAGQFWRFLTPALLHGSIPHIAFNMYALFVFGPGLERHFGHWRFLLLYVLGAFTGNVLSFLLSSGYSIGASTAIFGLIGAEGVFLFQNRKLFGSQFKSAIGNVIFIVAVNLFIGLAPGIDGWGHVGGLLGGLIFAWFAGPRWEVEGMYPALQLADKREPREVLTGAAVVILIFGALAMIGMFYPLVP
ncbi:MAG: rhomboid family intramembrane serine protease [Chloroflexi bacterium]|nr:rhomboid family intramembrane serine protease [Chloroflexota bacterium]